MAQRMIPCFFMRGGTSRGVFFLKEHLPRDQETANKVLLEVMGSPDPRQIDGLGGGTSTTSKVAIISVSEKPGVDIDYQFAQVGVTQAVVDWEPSCGNMLAGVGPAAIEMGLIPQVDQVATTVRIRALNNGSYVEALVQTPYGQVEYEGDTVIDGVPGSAAPIALNFKDVVGSKTGGKLLPTGNLRDMIEGVEVTCIDCAMPIVIAQASAMGKTGHETREELDADPSFFALLERIRVQAGKIMGLGDVTGKVLPKFAIVAPPLMAKGKSNLAARYFVPTCTHATMAVTGGISISCCSILEGTVAYDVSEKTMVGKNNHKVVIEHPSGVIEFLLDAKPREDGELGLEVSSAGVLRTARLLFTGMVRIPDVGLRKFASEPKEFSDMEREFRNLYRAKEDLRHREDSWVTRLQNMNSAPRAMAMAMPMRAMVARGLQVPTVVAQQARRVHVVVSNFPALCGAWGGEGWPKSEKELLSQFEAAEPFGCRLGGPFKHLMMFSARSEIWNSIRTSSWCGG